MAARYAAIVLAGGAGRRLGGADKPSLIVAGQPMLHRVLDAVAGAEVRVVVGPRRDDLDRKVLVTSESPPGGGPVAATAAGLAALSSAGFGTLPDGAPAVVAAVPDAAPRVVGSVPDGEPGVVGALPDDAPGVVSAVPDGAPAVVALLAADLPWLTRDAVDRLVNAVATGIAGTDTAGQLDGALYVDDNGRRQLLCGAWRRDSLTRRLAAVGEPTGVSMRTLLSGLSVLELASDDLAWFDCDTDDDLRTARERWRS